MQVAILLLVTSSIGWLSIYNEVTHHDTVWTFSSRTDYKVYAVYGIKYGGSSSISQLEQRIAALEALLGV